MRAFLPAFLVLLLSATASAQDNSSTRLPLTPTLKSTINARAKAFSSRVCKSEYLGIVSPIAPSVTAKEGLDRAEAMVREMVRTARGKVIRLTRTEGKTPRIDVLLRGVGYGDISYLQTVVQEEKGRRVVYIYTCKV